MTKKEFVQSERKFSVDLLSKLNPEQWKAKTLCDGWRVEDLAAHLVSRERNLIGGIGLVVPGLHSLHEKRIERVKAKGYDYILNKLAHYPWWMAASLNTSEFYVHNEDMLRGELKMHRPEPSKQEQKYLWDGLKGLVRVKKDMIADLGNVTIKNSQTGEEIHLKNKKTNKTVTISGLASEDLLFFYGRRDVAKVKIKSV